MLAAATLRREIESALADRIPAALTPRPHMVRPVWPSGVAAVDELLRGGLPEGAITEMAGPECSGRTSLALSFVASCTQAGKVCAWVDVSDNLSPEAAAASGICLNRLLWIRCGVSQAQEPAYATSFRLPAEYLTSATPIKGLHGGGCGGHPRNEVKGLAGAVEQLLDSPPIVRSRNTQLQLKTERKQVSPVESPTSKKIPARKPWSRMEQAMRATDLLLQTGGFAAVVLDMGSIAPEAVLRVPLATWFRYRAAAERTQANVILLTQTTCAKSSAGLVLHLEQATELGEETTVFSGLSCHVHVARERFMAAAHKVVPLRKPPHGDRGAHWEIRSVWAAGR
jgi:recombination protein RecA